VLPSLKASRLGAVSLITILHIKLCSIKYLFSLSVLVNISKYDVISVLQLPIHYSEPYKQSSGPGSVVGIATAYGLDGPGIESRWGEIFRTSPDRP